MLNINKIDNWYIIENIIFIWNWNWNNDNYVNLSLQRWDDIIMWCTFVKQINYPWEYDINNVYFKVFDNNWKLNYIISNLNWKNIAYITSVEILEKEEFDNIDFWLFSDPIVEEFLNKMEYEWEKIKLDL